MLLWRHGRIVDKAEERPWLQLYVLYDHHTQTSSSSHKRDHHTNTLINIHKLHDHHRNMIITQTTWLSYKRLDHQKHDHHTNILVSPHTNTHTNMVITETTLCSSQKQHHGHHTNHFSITTHTHNDHHKHHHHPHTNNMIIAHPMSGVEITSFGADVDLIRKGWYLLRWNNPGIIDTVFYLANFYLDYPFSSLALPQLCLPAGWRLL